MEFERNKATTAEDIALADTPRVTIDPMHNDIRIESTDGPRTGGSDAEKTFKFETESTESAALSATNISNVSHHLIAIMLAFGTIIAFIVVIGFLLVTR